MSRRALLLRSPAGEIRVSILVGPPVISFASEVGLWLASCWPLPQHRLPVSAAGGGRLCCRPFHRPPYCLRQQGPTPADTCSGNNRRALVASAYLRRRGGGWFAAKRLNRKLVCDSWQETAGQPQPMRCSFTPPAPALPGRKTYDQSNHPHLPHKMIKEENDYGKYRSQTAFKGPCPRGLCR